LLAELPRHQPIFARSGGVHAAGIARASGEWIAVFEDVGRHNAVDKAIGHALLSGQTADLLVVSSRAGFEIIQKACVAGIACVVCLSAATSLAVDTARALGLTLLGFARDSSCNVYAGEDRLQR
jgi:FdhD protein